jgi:hypothetical protein
VSLITESARGEECQIRMPGCSFNREQTVWAHANGSAAGKGIGMKSPDLLGAYACFNCHRVVDGQMKPPLGWTRDDVRLAFWEGHARSILKLMEKNLIVTERGRVFA